MLNNLFDAFSKMLNIKITPLPHPEEPMNPSATLANTDVNAIISKWLSDWEVPPQYWDYWKTAIDIQVYEVYPPSLIAMGLNQDTPAVTWEADGTWQLSPGG